MILFVSLPFCNKNNLNYKVNKQKSCSIGLLTDYKQQESHCAEYKGAFDFDFEPESVFAVLHHKGEYAHKYTCYY